MMRLFHGSKYVALLAIARRAAWDDQARSTIRQIVPLPLNESRAEG